MGGGGDWGRAVPPPGPPTFFYQRGYWLKGKSPFLRLGYSF